jgi:RNA polymerase-binding transcription factor DksA
MRHHFHRCGHLEELRGLRTARLEAIDRGLDALARRQYGDCASCRQPIETARLRIAPDTVVCSACAGSPA